MQKSKHPLKTINKIYNTKISKQIARESIKMNVKKLDKVLAKKMKNLYHFTNKKLKNGSKNNLESHNVNHANSILILTPIYRDFGIETRYFNKFLSEMATIYARLIIQ